MESVYGTLKKQCISTLLDKLKTKMPTAGEQEKKLLDALWEEEVDEDKDKDADQAKQISDQLLKNMNKLLKHVDNRLPSPPQGWKPLATAVLGVLEELDAMETGNDIAVGGGSVSAEAREDLRQSGSNMAAAMEQAAPTAGGADADADAEGAGSAVERMHNIGLHNLGNTCYMNATLQVLLGEPNIVAALREANSSVVAGRLAELVKMMLSADTAISPNRLVDAIYDVLSPWVQQKYQAKRGAQQCADEFLYYLFEAVKELVPCLSFSERTLPAIEWTPGSSKLNVDLVPGLDRPASLGALIHAQYAGAEKKVEIGQPSGNLMVVMKRSARSGSKDNTKISISELLSLFDGNDTCIGQFKLIGYVEHHGPNAKSGHYTATSKRTMPDGTEAWLHFDDAKEPARRDEDTVLKKGGRSAYVLFFSRTGDGGNAPMPLDLKREVSKVKETMSKAADQDVAGLAAEALQSMSLRGVPGAAEALAEALTGRAAAAAAGSEAAGSAAAAPGQEDGEAGASTDIDPEDMTLEQLDTHIAYEKLQLAIGRMSAKDKIRTKGYIKNCERIRARKEKAEKEARRDRPGSPTGSVNTDNSNEDSTLGGDISDDEEETQVGSEDEDEDMDGVPDDEDLSKEHPKPRLDGRGKMRLCAMSARRFKRWYKRFRAMAEKRMAPLFDEVGRNLDNPWDVAEAIVMSLREGQRADETGVDKLLRRAGSTWLMLTNGEVQRGKSAIKALQAGINYLISMDRHCADRTCTIVVTGMVAWAHSLHLKLQTKAKMEKLSGQAGLRDIDSDSDQSSEDEDHLDAEQQRMADVPSLEGIPHCLVAGRKSEEQIIATIKSCGMIICARTISQLRKVNEALQTVREELLEERDNNSSNTVAQTWPLWAIDEADNQMGSCNAAGVTDNGRPLFQYEIELFKGLGLHDQTRADRPSRAPSLQNPPFLINFVSATNAGCFSWALVRTGLAHKNDPNRAVFRWRDIISFKKQGLAEGYVGPEQCEKFKGKTLGKLVPAKNYFNEDTLDHFNSFLQTEAGCAQICLTSTMNHNTMRGSKHQQGIACHYTLQTLVKQANEERIDGKLVGFHERGAWFTFMHGGCKLFDGALGLKYVAPDDLCGAKMYYSLAMLSRAQAEELSSKASGLKDRIERMEANGAVEAMSRKKKAELKDMKANRELFESIAEDMREKARGLKEQGKNAMAAAAELKELVDDLAMLEAEVDSLKEVHADYLRDGDLPPDYADEASLQLEINGKQQDLDEKRERAQHQYAEEIDWEARLEVEDIRPLLQYYEWQLQQRDPGYEPVIKPPKTEGGKSSIRSANIDVVLGFLRTLDDVMVPLLNRPEATITVTLAERDEDDNRVREVRHLNTLYLVDESPGADDSGSESSYVTDGGGSHFRSRDVAISIWGMTMIRRCLSLVGVKGTEVVLSVTHVLVYSGTDGSTLVQQVLRYCTTCCNIVRDRGLMIQVLCSQEAWVAIDGHQAYVNMEQWRQPLAERRRALRLYEAAMSGRFVPQHDPQHEAEIREIARKPRTEDDGPPPRNAQRMIILASHYLSIPDGLVRMCKKLGKAFFRAGIGNMLQHYLVQTAVAGAKRKGMRDPVAENRRGRSQQPDDVLFGSDDSDDDSASGPGDTSRRAAIDQLRTNLIAAMREMDELPNPPSKTDMEAGVVDPHAEQRKVYGPRFNRFTSTKDKNEQMQRIGRVLADPDLPGARHQTPLTEIKDLPRERAELTGNMSTRLYKLLDSWTKSKGSTVNLIHGLRYGCRALALKEGLVQAGVEITDDELAEAHPDVYNLRKRALGLLWEERHRILQAAIFNGTIHAGGTADGRDDANWQAFLDHTNGATAAAKRRHRAIPSSNDEGPAPPPASAAVPRRPAAPPRRRRAAVVLDDDDDDVDLQAGIAASHQPRMVPLADLQQEQIQANHAAATAAFQAANAHLVGPAAAPPTAMDVSAAAEADS